MIVIKIALIYTHFREITSHSGIIREKFGIPDYYAYLCDEFNKLAYGKDKVKIIY